MVKILNLIANDFLNILLTLLCFSVVLIVLQKNPVYAVFSFIFTALLTFIVLWLIRAEFFALLILIIYTGVITVLFLFVVIMYNLREIQISVSNIFFNPFFILVYTKIYSLSKIIVTGCSEILSYATTAPWLNCDSFNAWTLDVVKFVGLYNDHAFLFFFCGLLLFVAILGSIVITYPFFKYKK